MKKIIIIISVLFISLNSCKESSDKNSKKEDQKPLAEFENLISEYNKWWSYHYYKIFLSTDFIALNEKSEKIKKDQFLKKLTSGNYITIELQSNDNSKTYKLFALPKNLDKSISKTIKQVSNEAYRYFKMEGTKFPDFNVVDLNGIKYNNEKLKGKTTIIKTWFIACKPCIWEMPELNEFVGKYKNEERIQFLSLALDTKPLLLNFLKKTEFKYAIIGEQKELIQNKLNLSAYPTHLVVNEQGLISKVFNNISELISYIENDTTLKNSEQKMLPPPPPPRPAPPTPLEKQ